MEKRIETKMMSGNDDLTAIYFNRYLIFRYATALFFFINLYWMIFAIGMMTRSAVIPICLFLTDIAIIVEQTSKYWSKSNRLSVTKIGYAIQILSHLFLLIFCISGQQTNLFPFVNQNAETFLLFVLVIGLLIAIVMEWKAWLIETNKDSYFNYIKKCEENSRMKGDSYGIRK